MSETVDLSTATVDELILELCGRFEAQHRGLVVMWEPLEGSEQSRREDPPDMTYRNRGSVSACIGMCQRFIGWKLRIDDVVDPPE